MVNHPNRKQQMTWAVDGDQWIGKGSLGTYKITEWMVAGGSNFVIGFKSKSASGQKGIGEFTSLANAKRAAEMYDAYRTVAA